MSVVNYFPNLVLLDFSQEVNKQSSGLGYQACFRDGDTKKQIGCLEQFVSLLLKVAGETKWSWMGIPQNFLYEKLREDAFSKSGSVQFIDYKNDEILNLFEKEGFKQGHHSLVNDLFNKNQSLFSIVTGFLNEDDNNLLLDSNFFKKIVHDLHSQPVWFIHESWLEENEGDIAELMISVLADRYNFIGYFPFVIFNDTGLCDYISLQRFEIEDRLVLKGICKNVKKNKNWTDSWNLEKAKELIQSIELNRQFKNKISPIKFKQNLLDEARKAEKKVLLVEGDDVRVLKAADLAIRLGITGLKIMGKKEEIERLFLKNNLDLLGKIEIIEPEKYHEQYSHSVYERMKRKNITLDEANELIKNDLVLGGILLHEGVVDGVVAGAKYTTADTLKAAIRMVGLEPGHSIISSFFLMVLPQDVMIFADCAVNPSPNSQQLADIALQSIHSAKQFFPSPIHASLISFSTMGSASTPEIEKIEQSLKIIHERIKDSKDVQPIIEGPVQYDAATNYKIAKTKFSHSTIAGRSNVMIFPNLETGNTVYKAVKESLKHDDCDCIGPIIQGLNKPYNDLSRGSTVEDIFQTILITIIQSNKQ